MWRRGGARIQSSLLSLDLGQGSELFWASCILIWGKEEETVSELLVVLFFTKLRGPREEGVASCDVPLACPSVLGFSPFPRALFHVSVGLCRVQLWGNAPQPHS